MFGKHEGAVEAGDKHIAGFIGQGMELEGKLSFEGTIRIEGTFRGEITSGATLIVGEGGLIEGTIKVDNAIITGEVKGTIEAKSRVELSKPAKVIGDITTPTLIICEGVIFEGNSIMTGSKPAAPSTYTAFKRPETAEKKENAGS